MRDAPLLIVDGTVVTFHYVLTDPDGDVIDRSSEGEPLPYLHGAGNIVPGLERALTGKASGAKLSVDVAPKDGYGERNDELVHAVPRESFPPDAELNAGTAVVAEAENGEHVPFWVVEADDEKVHIDGNHPLAGVPLHFEIEVVDVRMATVEERTHGHVHGPGGHSH